MTIFSRSQRLLNLKDFAEYVSPLDCGVAHGPPPENQYVLRMMVRYPGGSLLIPKELEWMRLCVEKCSSLQKENGLDPAKDFIYVTVRNGVVATESDDLWHVDGFSMRYPHRPEQNYICASEFGTEVLQQGFHIPDDYDPRKHNIHWFFQERADEKKATILPTGRLFLIDPYVVHRRQKLSFGKMRKFFRISFIPLEVEDDTCMPNPLMPLKVYNRNAVEEVRKKLTRYAAPSSVEVASKCVR